MLGVNKFPDCLESFQTVWKVSRLSGNFQDCVEGECDEEDEGGEGYEADEWGEGSPGQ